MNCLYPESTDTCSNSLDMAELQEKCRPLVDEYSRLEQLLYKDKLILNDSFEYAIDQFMQNTSKPLTKDTPITFLKMLEQLVDDLRQRCIENGIQV